MGALFSVISVLSVANSVPSKARAQSNEPVTAWQGWAKVASGLTGTPAIAFDLDRAQLDLVTVAADGAVRHVRRAGDTWSMPALEVRTPVAPALVVDPEAVLHLVVTGAEGAVSHSRFGDGRWSAAAPAPGVSTVSPALAYSLFGRSVELVVTAPDGALTHSRLRDGQWSVATPVGATAAGAAVLGTNFQDDSLDLIARAPDGTLFHRRFSGNWSAIPGLTGSTRLRPALVVGATGSLELVVTQPGGAIAHNRRVAGRWLGWQSLGMQSDLAPALVYNSDADSLELVAATRDGSVAHMRFVNGAWTRWQPLPGVTAAATPSLVQGAGGDLELAVTGTDGALWLNRFRPTAPGLVSYTTAIRPLFDAHCTNCHEGPRPPMGLGLDAARAYDQSVNIASREARRLRRVDPGSPDTSYLYLKLLGTHATAGGSGTRMPPEASLTDAEIARVRDWIAQGALRN